MPSSAHKVGIIGANWSLKVHGSAWRMLPGVEIGAVCTAHRETAEAAAHAFGIPRAYWDVAKMLTDPDLTIIDVGTKPSQRYDMVMGALRAGKHVYNCLPFATDLGKAREQLTAQRAAKRVGVVDAQFRWTPAGRYMKQLVEGGTIGRPLGFSVQLLLPLRNEGEGKLYPHSVWPEGGISPYRWLAEKSSGAGGWRNFSMHALLFLTYLLGPVSKAVGALRTGVAQWQLPDGSRLTPETEDLGCAVLQLRNGAIGTMQTGWAQPDGQYLRVELWGDRGRLLLDDPSFGDGVSARLRLGEARIPGPAESSGREVEIPAEFFRVAGTPITRENATPYISSMCHLFADMLYSIENGHEGSPSFAEAVHAHSVMDAVLQSNQMVWPEALPIQ
jgi:predicted dehydrogenase